jgi:YbbR domain-containing protein
MIRIFRDIFVRNWALKLLAFFIALVLWLLLVPEDKVYSEKTLVVPLETRNVPRDMELVEKPAATVDITVRAPNRLLNQISPSNIYARLDLERATPFQKEYPLNVSAVILPPGAEVVRIVPNQVSLRLEPAREIKLAVYPLIIGRPAEGFRIASIEVVPAQVLVRGPESKIRDRDRVTTTPVDVGGLSQPAVFDADLIMPKPELRAISALNRVKVTVRIESEAVEAKPAKK